MEYNGLKLKIRQNPDLCKFLYQRNQNQTNLRYYFIDNQPTRKYRMGQWMVGLMKTRVNNKEVKEQIVWIIKQGMVSSKIQQHIKQVLVNLQKIKQNPNRQILEYYDYFYRNTDSFFYVICSYFDGIPLQFKAMSPCELFNNISLQLLEGFKHLQFLKIFTANFMILVNKKMQIKIADFGLQRAIDALNYQYNIQSNICINYSQLYKPHPRFIQLYNQYIKQNEKQFNNKSKKLAQQQKIYTWLYALIVYNKLYSIFQEQTKQNKNQYQIRNSVGEYSHTSCSLLKCLNLNKIQYGSNNYKTITYQIIQQLKNYDEKNTKMSNKQVEQVFNFYTDNVQTVFYNQESRAKWITTIIQIFKKYLFQPYSHRANLQQFISIFHKNTFNQMQQQQELNWKKQMIEYYLIGNQQQMVQQKHKYQHEQVQEIVRREIQYLAMIIENYSKLSQISSHFQEHYQDIQQLSLFYSIMPLIKYLSQICSYITALRNFINLNQHVKTKQEISNNNQLIIQQQKSQTKQNKSQSIFYWFQLKIRLKQQYNLFYSQHHTTIKFLTTLIKDIQNNQAYNNNTQNLINFLQFLLELCNKVQNQIMAQELHMKLIQQSLISINKIQQYFDCINKIDESLAKVMFALYILVSSDFVEKYQKFKSTNIILQQWQQYIQIFMLYMEISFTHCTRKLQDDQMKINKRNNQIAFVRSLVRQLFINDKQNLVDTIQTLKFLLLNCSNKLTHLIKQNHNSIP